MHILLRERPTCSVRNFCPTVRDDSLCTNRFSFLSRRKAKPPKFIKLSTETATLCISLHRNPTRRCQYVIIMFICTATKLSSVPHFTNGIKFTPLLSVLRATLLYPTIRICTSLRTCRVTAVDRCYSSMPRVGDRAF